MIDLISGQRVTISNNLKIGNISFILTQSDNTNINNDIDLYAFLFDNSNHIYQSKIVFYSNIEEYNSILYSEDFINNYQKQISINFSTLPENMSKILIGSTIYKNSEEIITSTINYTLQINNLDSGTIMFNLHDKVYTSEKQSILLGEIYKYKNLWKFKTMNISSNDTLFQAINSIYN